MNSCPGIFRVLAAFSPCFFAHPFGNSTPSLAVRTQTGVIKKVLSIELLASTLQPCTRTTTYSPARSPISMKRTWDIWLQIPWRSNLVEMPSMQ
ncbi:hypothetical protein DL96DRAFT_798287 [Flagelloscypha sp. PMI_526]|nr:hypothetical protein DL96DRAFT_798287 [Flagelloscypha sp. PMI_526]